MKQYYLIVLVLLLNLTFGSCNDCEEGDSVLIGTTPRTNELEVTVPTPDPETVPTPDPETVPTPDPATVSTTDPTTVSTTDDTTVLTTDPTTVSTTDDTTVSTTDPTTVLTTDPTTVLTTDATTVSTPESTTEESTTTEPSTTTQVPTTIPPPTTTKQPVTVPNNPCETTTVCATTKKSTAANSILYFAKSSDCLNLKSGTVLIDANHCRRYYVCASGKAKRYRCPVGNWYDRQLSSCRSRAEVTNCPANRN